MADDTGTAPTTRTGPTTTTGLPGVDALTTAVLALDAAHKAALLDADLIRQRAERRHPEHADPGDLAQVEALTDDPEYGAWLDHVRRLDELAHQLADERAWLTGYLDTLR